TLFEEDNIDHLAALIFKASRLAPVAFHINKGLAGASVDVMKSNRDTAMNPAAMQAAGLIIMAAGDSQVYPHVAGYEVNQDTAKQAVKRINEAMQLFKQAAPDAGTYANEADYFEKNWQQTFWGTNYKKLLSVKYQYDPDGLFYCHHCVGSEYWREAGLC